MARETKFTVPLGTSHEGINTAGQEKMRWSRWAGAHGWCSGESARLPPMCPGFDSRTRRHMWVEFVVGSRPCSENFSPGSSCSKINISKFQFDQEFESHGFVSRRLLSVTLVKQSLFIYLFIQAGRGETPGAVFGNVNDIKTLPARIMETIYLL